jgi:hypothetical protein
MKVSHTNTQTTHAITPQSDEYALGTKPCSTCRGLFFLSLSLSLSPVLAQPGRKGFIFQPTEE